MPARSATVQRSLAWRVGGSSWREVVHRSHVDGRRSVVAGAGRFAGFLDAVAVVPGSFDGAGAGAFAAFGDQQVGDLGEALREGVSPVLRGECPPSRWRFGGSGAVLWRRRSGRGPGRPRRTLSRSGR